MPESKYAKIDRMWDVVATILETVPPEMPREERLGVFAIAYNLATAKEADAEAIQRIIDWREPTKEKLVQIMGMASRPLR